MSAKEAARHRRGRRPWISRSTESAVVTAPPASCQLANRKPIGYHRRLTDEVPLHRRGLASSILRCSAIFYGT